MEKKIVMAQSHSIERYLASEFGLDGKSKHEKLQCDMFAEQIRDYVDALINLYRKPSGEDKKNEIEKFFADTERGFPSKMAPINTILEANKDGFLVGSSLTYADVLLVSSLDWLFSKRDEILSQYPSIKKHEQKMLSLPIIGEHLKKYANLPLTILKPE